ncbi:kunitz-type serine protease inhibitor PPTI [Ixodes scapularis]|uniref:kunitz-type serine protease inhibitor PPTI n=1 Tax=Ixodes scapularis TaxID=6945 RepID=UPI001A9DF280|nr:kunitz-type serine protease inhibitor PPTI [Ixodes scapularis]
MKVLVFTVVVMILVAASEGRRWPGMPGPGPCKAAFPRYKCVEGRCLEYIYGGCGRDGGGYRSMAECKRRCKGLRFPIPRPPTERRRERTLVVN